MMEDKWKGYKTKQTTKISHNLHRRSYILKENHIGLQFARKIPWWKQTDTDTFTLLLSVSEKVRGCVTAVANLFLSMKNRHHKEFSVMTAPRVRIRTIFFFLENKDDNIRKW